MKQNTSTKQQSLPTDFAPWRDADNYKYTDSHSTRDWGWEFLRRNPLYQEEWELQLQGFHEDKDFREKNIQAYCWIDHASSAVRKEWPKRKNGNDTSLTQKEINEKIAFYKKHGINITDPEEYKTFEIFGFYCWRRWGMMSYQDPRSERLTKCNRYTVLDPFPPITGWYPGIAPIQIEEGECYARIDLCHPLSSQLKTIKQFAEAHKKEFVKAHPDYVIGETAVWKLPKTSPIWKRYLRVLDAYILGAKRKDAAEVIFGKVSSAQTVEKQWNDALKKAKQYSFRGFRELLL